MTEWWTYRPSDFLMFSPTTWWRLVESYNRAAWPGQVLTLAVGLLLLWLAWRPRPSSGRAVALALVVVWLWVGWAFHWQRYANINWAAGYLALAFGLQAALLLVAGIRGVAVAAPAAGNRLRHAGLAMAVAGIALYPLIAPATGRPWSQAEVFGLMPEPTALASIGLLLATAQPYRKWLLVIPTLSLALGWTTLWTLMQ